MPATGDREPVRTSREIAGVDSDRIQILDVPKPEAREIASQFGRIEEQLKWFAGPGHSCGQRVERQLLHAG